LLLRFRNGDAHTCEFRSVQRPSSFRDCDCAATTGASRNVSLPCATSRSFPKSLEKYGHHRGAFHLIRKTKAILQVLHLNVPEARDVMGVSGRLQSTKRQSSTQQIQTSTCPWYTIKPAASGRLPVERVLDLRRPSLHGKVNYNPVLVLLPLI
jgi:hypothetical protein